MFYTVEGLGKLCTAHNSQKPCNENDAIRRRGFRYTRGTQIFVLKVFFSFPPPAHDCVVFRDFFLVFV